MFASVMRLRYETWGSFLVNGWWLGVMSRLRRMMLPCLSLGSGGVRKGGCDGFRCRLVAARADDGPCVLRQGFHSLPPFPIQLFSFPLFPPGWYDGERGAGAEVNLAVGER